MGLILRITITDQLGRHVSERVWRGTPQQHGPERARLRLKGPLGLRCVLGGRKSTRGSRVSEDGSQKKDERSARGNNNVVLEAGGRILLRNYSVSQHSVGDKRPKDMAWKVEQ